MPWSTKLAAVSDDMTVSAGSFSDPVCDDTIDNNGDDDVKCRDWDVTSPGEVEAVSGGLSISKCPSKYGSGGR